MSRRWRWKSTVIDFSKLPDECPDGRFNGSKKDRIFRYLPLPDDEEREWINGCYSSEYNEALRYAIEYGLVEEWEEEEGRKIKHYLVTGKEGRFYWYYNHDGSATAIMQPGRIFETIEEAERVFDEALKDKDSNAEEVTLYEIDGDGNERIVKRERPCQ